ncbi:unnamed protein product [Echinostoma caproni]|uniref:Secreted protein n=1 Tax=Echinostoma caproni TaxID=27848 RepID=A0A183AVE6_9TREM|nr:unnamed protein product [Echinostoma caproni]
MMIVLVLLVFLTTTVANQIDLSFNWSDHPNSFPKVLEELGIEMSNEMAGLQPGNGPLGTGANAARNRPVAVDGAGLPSVNASGPGSTNDTIDEDDLEARLARLKRG